MKSLFFSDSRYFRAQEKDKAKTKLVTIDNETIVPPTHRVSISIDDSAYKGKQIIKKGKKKAEGMTRTQYANTNK